MTADVQSRQGSAAVATTFHVFDTRAAAEDAIRLIGHSGFDMKKLSLVGKGCHGEETPMGVCSAGDRIKSWGGIWGLLLAPAVFVLPGLAA